MSTVNDEDSYQLRSSGLRLERPIVGVNEGCVKWTDYDTGGVFFFVKSLLYGWFLGNDPYKSGSRKFSHSKIVEWKHAFDETF